MRVLFRSLLLLTSAFVTWSCSDPPPQTTACTSDTECRAGERCTAAGQCVVGAECVNEAECVAKDPRKLCDLATSQCVFREGFGDECDETRPCPFGQFCTELLGLCLDSASAKDCVRRSQCPSGQICDAEVNKCIPDLGCYGDQFCEDGEVCDLVNRTCRAFTVECDSCALGDANCPGGTFCFTESKECLAAPQDKKCNDGEQCDALGRCVQCTQQSECGPGLYCNVSLGRCESNVQCVEDVSQCPPGGQVQCITCNEPEICDPRTRRCQSPAVPCDNDLACGAGERCDKSVDPPVCVRRQPDCLPDLLDEPANDTLATARVLDSNQGPLYDSLKLCQGDQDWYRIDVAAGTYLTVDARFLQADGDVELQLYLPDGRTLLDESRSTSDNERVELEVGTDLSLLLRVFLALPTIREVPYRLIVARDPGAVCADDGNEPDDGRPQAQDLAPSVPYEGRLCAGDPDWFALRSVAPMTRIEAQLDFVDNLGDLDLELYRTGSPLPILVANGLRDGERLSYDASFGGDYFLRILGKGGDSNVYTLRATLLPGGANACLDDRLEPNQGPLTASATVTPPATELTLCAGDQDWYRVSLRPGEGLTAEIGFSPDADLDLALYPGDAADPNVTPLIRSAGVNPREYLSVRAGVPNDFLVRVYGHTEDDISPYTLDLKVVPPLVCMPDANDQLGVGNSEADPVFVGLPPVSVDNMSICPPDSDWYQLFLEGGFVNLLSMHYLGIDGQLHFALFDQLGTEIFSTVGLPDDTQRVVSINVPGVGFALLNLQVFSLLSGRGNYDLNLDLVPLFSCFPDPAEPNNQRELASLAVSSTVGPMLVKELTLCATEGGQQFPGDEDWYVINPPVAGARIEAAIEFSQGDLSLELFSPNGGPRACVNFGENRCYSDGFDLNERVTFTATVAQPYYLRVGSVYASPNVPVRPADADTDYQLQVDFVLP